MGFFNKNPVNSVVIKRFFVYLKLFFNMKYSYKDLGIVLGFMFLTISFLFLFDPLNNIYVASNKFEKVLVFLVIFCLGICLYSLRRWRVVVDEASEIRRLEKHQRELKIGLENEVEERTKDLKEAFSRILPENIAYAHNEKWGDGNGHSHIRASILGPSLSIPISSSNLIIGTWQQIVLVDFDNRPRNREIILQIVGE